VVKYVEYIKKMLVALSLRANLSTGTEAGKYRVDVKYSVYHQDGRR
jgi:hypothetical protein